MSSLHTHVAFHLTGRTITADLDPVDELALRPALLARYRDLSALRYDFPVVLRGQSEQQTSVESLSGLIDAALRTLADHESIDRLTAHALRLEREIRVIVADGEGGPFDAVWDLAALRLTASGDPAWRDSLDRLRAAVNRDGEIVDCDAAMPTRLFRHLWSATQAKKARTFGDRVALLLVKLGDILRADFAQSPQSRTATALEASFGEAHEEAFDFEALAQVLEHRVAAEPLPDQRRRRIERLIQVLESQRFWVRAGADAGTAPYAFVFDTCQSAFAACRERAPQMAVVAQALAAAELEVRGDYRAPHDVFFGHRGVEFAPLAPEEQALFPDYLVTLNEAMLTPLEQATLTEMLAAGLPVKILLQIDDLLTEPSTMDDPVSAGGRARELIHMAIGLNDVYALQASASHLVQRRHEVVSGLEYAGAALFSVFSGATGVNDLPPYLVAAAAMESRAFPAFTYDPAAGGDWASRFSLDGNTHVGADWPVLAFSYEDEGHQGRTEDLAFTLVDFIACDPRHGRHFASVPRRAWNDHLVPVADALAAARPGTVPSLLLVDAANRLHKVVVSETVLREARRCRQRWHSLQELAGIHNSHVERRLARDPEPRIEPPPSPAPVRAAAPEAPADRVDAPSDDPYIETPRCTTCNECTGINNVMFAYNANKQAYIANPGAGTYAQLVEAAESCQVSIIHPGKPRNPNEPGLAELLKRAELFL